MRRGKRTASGAMTKNVALARKRRNASNTMGVQVGSGPSSKVKKMRLSPQPCNRPPLFRVSQIELGFLLGSLFSQLGLPVKRLDEGLAVLVPLLVVANLPDLPFGKPLCLLHYVLDTQVVIVLQRRNLRAFAGLSHLLRVGDVLFASS